ncbi:MAG: hypothetical protein HRU40_02020 [Saprospiraceae bacterium]|nr:hypothetical protein [Saprospiraceae bacterium]
MNRKTFIHGIFNYCDSWCDRCPFTAQCRVFEPDLELEDDKASILEGLSLSLHESMQVLKVYVEEHGKDWAAFQQEVTEVTLSYPEDHKHLIKLAETYALRSRRWINKNEVIIRARGDELVFQIEMGLHVLDKGLALADALEVIQWFIFFIKAKVRRAVRSLNELNKNEQLVVQNDANGSAKAALLAIDRTLLAWHQVLDSFPNHTDAIIDILVPLNHLKTKLEQAFSNARAFVRPGFDE